MSPLIVVASSPRFHLEKFVDPPNVGPAVDEDLVFPDSFDQLLGNIRFIHDFADDLFQ